jgi:hypothetical protein
MPNEITPRQSTIACILTDIHFWVPVAVLTGGLALLTFLH